jgi:ketopantoate reductase
MKALVVGAGAVGQVFGRHLQLGGAEVTFLVREKYAAESRQGFTLYPLNRRDKTQPVRLEGAGVVTGAAGDWDQIYITVSSTALRSGDWLADVGGKTGRSTIVMLQPGFEDLEHVRRFVPEADRIVNGLISFIAYQAPLPGETRFASPGLAYWFPPLGPSPFSGASRERAAAVVGAQRAGGMPAKLVRDVPAATVFPAALLNAHIVALEAAGWRFDAVRRDGWLSLAGRAGREAAAVAARANDARLPFARFLLGSLVMRAVLRVAPWIIPLDLETYLRVHFIKVGDQTRLHTHSYIEGGRKLGLPVAALERLVERLPALPAHA